MPLSLQDAWQKDWDWLIRGYSRMVSMLEELERDAPTMSNKNLADIESITKRLQAVADRTRATKNGPREDPGHPLPDEGHP